MWRPFTPDKDRVLYHVDLDDNYEWLPHEMLDDVPKKSLGQQIADLVEMGDRLAESRIRALDLPDVGDGDPDDADPGYGSYPDPEDLRRAADSLNDKVAKASRERNRSKKDKEAVKPPESAQNGDSTTSE